MRVLIIYDVEGWAYHRRALALQKNAPPDISVSVGTRRLVSSRRVSITEQDLVFLLDYASVRWWKRLIRSLQLRIPLVVSHNADSHRRHGHFRACVAHADLVICNNREVWLHNKRHPKTVCISNGVDMTFFRPAVDILERPLRCLWTGSDNPKKGKGYQEVLQPLAQQTTASGFDCSFRPVTSARDTTTVFSQSQMHDWYNTGSFILCASRSEGTPNTTLEGAACGCIPVTTNVGNIREFGSHQSNCVIVERDPAAFLEGMQFAATKRKEMSENVINSLRIGGWDWATRSQYFWAVFRKAVHVRPSEVGPFCYQDIAPDQV